LPPWWRFFGVLVGYLAWDRHVRNIENTAIATKNEEMAALAKKNESTNETILAPAQQLVAASQTQAAPAVSRRSAPP
jgi:hypothetical protein